MKLQDIFTQLSVGEFSQLRIGGEEMGVINDVNKGAVIAHINLGLTSLYRRFNLKQGKTSIMITQDQDMYTIAGDVLKIERVLTPDGAEFGLNDASDELACATPTMNTLRVPEKVINPTDETPDWALTTLLKVYYKAGHPKVTEDTVDLELPDSHLEALLYFIASRVHNPIGMSNEFHAGNNYAQKYELACQELERMNMRIDVGQTSNRLRQKGFP